MASRGPSKKKPADPRREPVEMLHESTATWTIQKTVRADTHDELERKINFITKTLQAQFDNVELQLDEEELPPDDEDEDEDRDEPPDGELDFD